MLKLNLGCGNDIREGFVNVDAVAPTSASSGEVVVQGIFQYIKSVERESVDFILLQDVLEHFSHGLEGYQGEVRLSGTTSRTANELLQKCFTALKVKGKIEIRIPDVDVIIKKYINNEINFDRFVWTMLGEIHNEQYDTHKCMWTEDSIQQAMRNVKFRDVTVEKQYPNMIVRAQK